MFIPKFKKAIEVPKSKQSMVLPLLPLRDVVIFPYMVVPLFVGRPLSVKSLNYAMERDKILFLTTQTKFDIDNPKEQDVYYIGVIGSILQLLKLPDGTVKALVEGRVRAKIQSYVKTADFFQVDVSPLTETDIPSESEPLIRSITDIFDSYCKMNRSLPVDLVRSITTITDPSQLSDTIAAHFPFKLKDKQEILEITSIEKRMRLLLEKMRSEIDIFQMEQKIKTRVKKQMEKSQRNYYLNEQMRAIKKEMGDESDAQDELNDLEKRIKHKRMSKEAAIKVRQEFQKLKLMASLSPEASVIRNYVEWIISLPWFEKSKTKLDMIEAERILNEDHYGLEKPKERILEYLAVQSLVKKIKGPILCFVGPPGVGKTSLAKSVARATGREFVRLSLGGVRDEAEIRGHRRTYIGSMPGKIIQSLKKAKVNNPVFCLDEVDKMSMDFRGDPSSALLEVLDPEQNDTFNDHYMDIDYDLSEILFITTANTLPDIPLPLQDRMEIIKLPGYTEYEKEHISVKFLIPKQLKANGLTEEQIKFSTQAIVKIIREYTKEAGVRNLEREMATICRKLAREIVSPKNKEKLEFPIVIEPDMLHKFLGPIKYRYGQVEKDDKVGLATGLAWTQVGGELLCAEAVIMPGKGQLIITGKLGDVMKESAHAAVSYARSRAKRLGIDTNFYKKFDIHVHVPEGAIPKDGPSAGITICTSIVSALTGRSARRDVAMTGEITLRGRILPIGGLKEKILAAHRGNISTVIIPKENEKDLEDIPQEIRDQIKIETVESMDEVLSVALILKENDILFPHAVELTTALPKKNDEKQNNDNTAVDVTTQSQDKNDDDENETDKK